MFTPMHTRGSVCVLCLLQAPRLEPTHEEDLTKGFDSVSLGKSTQALSTQIW